MIDVMIQIINATMYIVIITFTPSAVIGPPLYIGIMIGYDCIS